MKPLGRQTLVSIYESMDFESSYDSNYDPNAEKLKADFNNNCHSLEKMLKGTIAYYKGERAKFLANPNDMNSFESVDALEQKLRPILAQLSQFT